MVNVNKKQLSLNTAQSNWVKYIYAQTGRLAFTTKGLYVLLEEKKYIYKIK